jgi:hypothetical protein
MAASLLLELGFWLLPAVTAGAVVAALAYGARARGAGGRRTVALGVAIAAWMALTLGLASSGALRFGPMPPRPMMLFAVGLFLTVLLSRSTAGVALAGSVPLWALVGAQSFRIPLELLLHRGALEGVVPPQMTHAGFNFDIASGVGAVLVAALLLRGRAPRWLVPAWNVMGVLLLVNVLAIAITSMPTPLRLFSNQPPNVWVAQAPFIWLPTVLVPAAVLGHLAVFRRLRELARGRNLSRAAPGPRPA